MASSKAAKAVANLSPAERTAFPHFFRTAAKPGADRISGEEAVAFFAKSKLPPSILGEIWQIADEYNEGSLSKDAFSVSLRLIGHAQRGKTPTDPLALESGAVPVFEGVSLANVSSPPSIPNSNSYSSSLPTASSNSSLARVQTGSLSTGAGSIPPIRAEDRLKFLRLFEGAGPVDGLLGGEKARDLFLRSRLSPDKLGLIWHLADTKSRGYLDVVDFTIAMHLIQKAMDGTLTNIPETLPPGFYEQAGGTSTAAGAPTSPTAGFGSGGIPRQMTGQSLPRQLTGQANVPSPLRQQYTGQQQQPAIPPVSRNFTGNQIPAPTLSPSATGFGTQFRQGISSPPPFSGGQFGQAQSGGVSPPWDISASEKASSDTYFKVLDPQNKGFVDGEVAGPFFFQSELGTDDLAKVWDLAAVRKDSNLDKDEFSVAMYLIKERKSGKELPDTLPLSLVPPALRGFAGSAAQPEPQQDLLSLDDLDFSAPASAAPTVQPSKAPAPASFPSPQPQSRQASATISNSTPFMSAQNTGASARGAGVKSPVDDLFGADGEDTSRIGADSARLGNLKNQVSSTERSVSNLQSQRKELESAVASSSSEINELEVRLSQAKAAHETEQKNVTALQARKEEQSATLVKLREELIRAESELSGLKVERSEIEGTLMREKEDVRDLKKRMQQVSEETSNIKFQLEKMRKDARQQKGLVAISKKQLATAETERDRSASELANEHEKGVAAAGLEHSTSFDDAFSPSATPVTAVNTALPTSPTVASPAASVRSTNPFERISSPAPGPTSARSPLSAQGTGGSFSSLDKTAAATAVGAVAAGTIGATILAGKEAVTEETDEEAPAHKSEEVPAASAPALASDDPLAPAGGLAKTESVAVAAAPVPAPAAGDGFDDEFDSAFGGPAATAHPESGSASIPEPDVSKPTQDTNDDPFAVPASASRAFETSTAFDDDFSSAFGAPSAPTVSELPAGTAAMEPSVTSLPGALPEEIPAVPSDVGISTKPKDEDVEEADSDDEDDEGPEDVISSRPYGREQPITSSGAPAPALTAAEAEAKFPELDESFGEDGAASNSTEANLGVPKTEISPQSTVENFEDAPTEPGTACTTTSPTAVPAVAAFDDAFGSPFSPPSDPATASQTPKPPTAAFAGPSAFDDAFNELDPVSATPSAPAARTVPSQAPKDDFDAAFGDLETVTASKSTNTGNLPDFDFSTEDPFTFDSAFAPSNNGPKTNGSSLPKYAPPVGPPPTLPPRPQDSSPPPPFESSAADFDAAFGTLNSNNAAPSGAAGFDSAFDDAFGTPSANAPSSRGPQRHGRSESEAAKQAKDAPELQRIMQLGFTRQQAINALSKHFYDVEKAIDELVGN